MNSWAWLVAVAISIGATSARAEEAPRIALVHTPSADERATVRLRAELSTLGLHVVDVALAASEGATSLDDAARRVGAFAAVQVVPAKAGVEVWIADRVTGKTLLRELVVAPGDALDDVVALQAVELLRASLVELRFSSHPRGDVRPTATVAHIAPQLVPPAPEIRNFLLQLGPGVATSPGGLGGTAHAFLGLRWRANRAFGFDVWSLVPVTHTVAQDGASSADVWPWIFGVDVSTWLFEQNAGWQLSAAGGIAVSHLAIDGHAEAPLASRADPLTIALPFARFSWARRLGTRFGIELDGFVGVASPRPVIHFAGREVAHWGRPLLFSTLSFEIALD